MRNRRKSFGKKQAIHRPVGDGVLHLPLSAEFFLPPLHAGEVAAVRLTEGFLYAGEVAAVRLTEGFLYAGEVAAVRLTEGLTGAHDAS